MNTPLDKPSVDTPTEDTSAGDTSVGDTSVGDTSVGDTSVGDTSVGAQLAETPTTETVRQRVVRSVKAVTPNALKTAWWLVRIMVIVTLAITFLKYFGVIAWMSWHLTPVFSWFGLPGEAALAYVSGYFVN